MKTPPPIFQYVTSLLLTTIPPLSPVTGYGKSSIANVVLALAKRVRLTYVRVSTDENSMHDPWAVWKPVIRFLLMAAGINKENGILSVLELLPIKDDEKARAVVWLHDIIPEQWCKGSSLRRRANGSMVQGAQQATRRGRKGSIIDEIDNDDLEDIEDDDTNMGAAGILTMKLEVRRRRINTYLRTLHVHAATN